ncbi:hypothetical protein BDZ94DRAFT_1213000 [Collybia nuda]|uniref:Uncharacterized protein n=1 Tax=Collybia nuda TaxID=64659 RepID=A0A9P6CLG5_9AGAR|nr:hypothetical protein BDZ94DRAFT_1213000 [Collybia nuda]
MGGAASKTSRKLPKRVETPKWAGVRTPGPSDRPTQPHERGASEVKTEAIERDAHDPQFMANLTKLGAVKVDHHMQSARMPVPSEMHKLFKSRAQSEYEASAPTPTRNRLHAVTLSDLLDERKSAKTRGDLQRLSDRHVIDFTKLESLSRYVSSPSVQGGTAVRTVGPDGEESLLMTAIWAEPRIQDAKSI